MGIFPEFARAATLSESTGRQTARPEAAKPMFEPGLWPGNNFNTLTHDLAALAELTKKKRLSNGERHSAIWN